MPKIKDKHGVTTEPEMAETFISRGEVVTVEYPTRILTVADRYPAAAAVASNIPYFVDEGDVTLAAFKDVKDALKYAVGLEG